MGKNRVFSRRIPQNDCSAEFAPRKARKTTRRRREIQYLTEDELERLFKAIDSKRDIAIFRLMAGLGLRSCEPAKLQLADFRDRAGRIYVHRAKGSNSGEYPLGRLAAAAIRAWIRERGTRPGPLFLSRNHRPIGRSMLAKLMLRYCDRAGIDRSKAHLHALKHTCGTHLAEEGLDVMRIQDWLGHRNVQNTLVYVHLANKGRNDVGEARREKW